MSKYLEEVLAARPALEPDTPFAAVVDAVADALVALAKVVDLVVEDPDFAEEFPLRDAAEQNAFGAKVAVSLLTFQALAHTVGDAVTDVFLASDEQEEAA